MRMVLLPCKTIFALNILWDEWPAHALRHRPPPAEALGLSVQLSLRVRAAEYLTAAGVQGFFYKMVLQVFALVIEFWTQFIYGNHIEKGMPSCPATKAAKTRRPSSAINRTSWTSSCLPVVSASGWTPCTTFTRVAAFGPSAATGGTTPMAASCDGALLIRLSLRHSPRSSKHLRVEHVASYSPIISAHHLVADVDP